METKQIQKIIEGAILAAGNAVSLDQLMSLFGMEDSQPTRDQVRSAIKAIEADCNDRGYELKKVASGYRFQVKQELSPWISRLWEEKPQKYSRALLETLAIIAYRQPMTRGDIEEIRGVSVSSNITKTLLEREWVRVVGHRDVPGKPALFATTKQFLDYFNLSRLDELPTLNEIRDLTELGPELAFSDEIMNTEVGTEGIDKQDDDKEHTENEGSSDNEVSNISESSDRLGDGEEFFDEELIEDNKAASAI